MRLLFILLICPLLAFGQSISFEEQDVPVYLPAGWSMFGYSCMDSKDVAEAFSGFEDQIVIVKDGDGNPYLPEYGYNGLGPLQMHRGYQIKLTEAITDFQFCPFINPLTINCTDENACNYNIAQGVCIYPDEAYDCNGNYSGFEVGDFAQGGVVFYTEENGQRGLVVALENVGKDEGVNRDHRDQYKRYEWGCMNDYVDGADNGWEYSVGNGYRNTKAILNQNCKTENGGITAAQAASDYESDLYDDWYLPSIGELREIDSKVGYEGSLGNLVDFRYDDLWSSSSSSSSSAIFFNPGSSTYAGPREKSYEMFVRAIRAFGFVFGCNDLDACNYDSNATMSDGSCWYKEYGFDCDGNKLNACPYDLYTEYYTPALNYDIDLCRTLVVNGCTDPIAENFNYEANTDNGTCDYLYGCTDFDAENYDVEATMNDGSCIHMGCMDTLANNFNSQANLDDGNCIYYGCMNPTAENYDIQANHDNGSCIIYGCTLSIFPNYNSVATLDDFSCDMSSTDIFGCTDDRFLEFSSESNVNNGTCLTVIIEGCMDSTACNYNPEANQDDGSCDYAEEGFDCEGNEITYQVGDLAQGGIVFYVDETGKRGLVAAAEGIEGNYEWGCYGYNVNGADGQAIGTGYQNTMDIVNQGCETIYGGITVAQAALDYESVGFNDWYLPSKYELLEMYNAIACRHSQGGVYDLCGWYFSSSEIDLNSVWGIGFGEGGWTGKFDKSHKSFYAFHPIRAFGYTQGCMDSTACNYNPEANMADGSCEYALEGFDCFGNILGCMDSMACNYSLEANMPDESCEYPMFGYDCEDNFSEYVVGMQAEGGIVFYVDSTRQHGLVAYLDLDGSSLAFDDYDDWYIPDSGELWGLLNYIKNSEEEEYLTTNFFPYGGYCSSSMGFGGATYQILAYNFSHESISSFESDDWWGCNVSVWIRSF